MSIRKFSRRVNDDKSSYVGKEATTFVAIPEAEMQQARQSREERDQERDKGREHGAHVIDEVDTHVAPFVERPRRAQYVGNREKSYLDLPEHELVGAYIEKWCRTSSCLNGVHFRGMLVRKSRKGEWEVHCLCCFSRLLNSPYILRLGSLAQR